MHRELEPDAEPGSAFSAAHLYNKGEVFEGVYQDARLLRIVRHFLGDDATIMSLGDNAINGVITPPHPGPQPDVISGLHNDGSLTGAFQGVGTPADDSRKIVSHVLCEHSNAALPRIARCRSSPHADAAVDRPAGDLVPLAVLEGARRHLLRVRARSPPPPPPPLCDPAPLTPLLSDSPGSHLVADLPVPPAPVPGQTNVEGAAGDVFLYNTALWHTAGANTSQHSR